MAHNVTATKDLMAAYFATLGDQVSLHTGSPGQTGTAEVSGGSPAYARQTTVWNTGGITNGLLVGSEVVFNVPAGTTVSHVGIWSSGGTFREWVDSSDITYTAQGELKVTPRFQQT